MKQFLIFAKGVAMMLVLMALIITCIGAFTTGDSIFRIASLISIIYLGYKIYDETYPKINKNNKE